MGETETLIATYTYDANGNRTSLIYANGTTTTYAYNKANLLTSVVNKKGNTTLSSHTYTYYLDGNIASENENGTTKTYEYDGLGRLTKETQNGTITIYTYDANGNRSTMTQNGSTTTYTYDANNRLLAETAVIPTLYYYDVNGNTIGIMKGGDPAGAYTYSLFGNQISYTPNGVLYIYYTYRPDGLRHSIGDKVHVWDGANIVADVDGNDISVYIRGANLIYADDGNIIYYHFNAHGDVVALTNENGTKTKSYAYSAFGVEYSPSDFDDNPFRYCGEYFDKETQTIYLRARYYNAEQGRFTQQDGWEFANAKDPLSLNLYTYCSNNPVTYIDPSGHFLLTAIVLGAIVATVLMTSGCSNEKEPHDYRENNSPNINCYMYAFDLAPHPKGFFMNPGRYSTGEQMYDFSTRKFLYDVNEIANFVIRDMEQLGKEVRLLKNPSEKEENEHLVALRSTTNPIYMQLPSFLNLPYSASILATDYHFAVQLSDGTWAEKIGGSASRWNKIDGTSPESWDSNYDSEIIYFAVKNDF